jgi:hypothetical protein
MMTFNAAKFSSAISFCDLTITVRAIIGTPNHRAILTHDASHLAGARIEIEPVLYLSTMWTPTSRVEGARNLNASGRCRRIRTYCRRLIGPMLIHMSFAAKLV